MLRGTGAPTPESGLHLALAGGPRHALPALLTTKTADRIPPPDVPAVDHHRDNEQNNEEQPRESNRGQYAVNKAAKDPAEG